ncbi:Sodium/calcium exchanger protein-domain-containing protein [Echria macrotheca]|uniref:Sodium/calcium exchanger protein-domain-containing protein n=1 Tax=Echria macrotheca TaxID=438768 RepID=A0AAJ0BLB9_9PEZI|nr:Sodium/calcium exchanger protein-domain-containing protein [Echria macrotheca]
MADAGVVAYNIAAFISTLFLLEFGADKFVDHTALAVIVASLARGRSSLAMGNIIGAAVSNILGAFSLGLLFWSGPEVIFDRSARIYSLLLLVLTTFAAPIVYFPARITWLVCGSLLVAGFAAYVVAVGLAIGRGLLAAPEGSDSGSDSSSGADSSSDSDSGIGHGEQRHRHGLWYHFGFLILGLLAISLAGYVLSQAATNITDEFGISDVLFGVVILAIATTLPEKFVAVMSGRRGHPGILVANCAGSNIFLLTLCVGIIMIDSEGQLDGGNMAIAELIVLWVSTLALTLTVWFGARVSRWIGAGMLGGYVVFIVLEFVLIHQGASLT